MADNPPPDEHVRRSETHPHHLVESIDVKPGCHLQLHPTPEAEAGNFFNFMEKSAQELIVQFFRQAIEEIERERKIRDYHLKLKPSQRRAGGGGFVLEVFYGENRAGPEKVEAEHCISCQDDAPLFPGAANSVLAGECVLPEFGDQPHVQCSLDAKARPGFIVTPRKHVERVADLDDAELYCLWSVSVRALQKEGLMFTSMILNHGTYRNLPHLHLKIWVDEKLWRHHAMAAWDDEKRGLWRRLERLTSGLPKKRALCSSFGRRGKCTYGDRCRFRHD